jgi:flagellar biosynthetic protein FliQ
MNTEYILSLGREAVMLTLLVSAPMLLFGLVVGLVISILQAITQVHEMTLTFVPKILAVAVALLIFLPWMLHQLVDFTVRLFGTIPNLTG